MTTKTLTSIQEAAALLIDALTRGTNVTLDLAFEDGAERAMEQLMTAVDEEARRRGVGVTVAPKEGSRVCLSLHRP